MLHAIDRRKTSFHNRYSSRSEREGHEKRVPAEDEITSLIFGPLDFMSAEQSITVWRYLLASAGRADFLPLSSPQAIDLSFWDRRVSCKDARPVEPDIVVRMRWPNGDCRTLLIEIKWNAGLSGEHQLRRQWEGYLRSDEERARAMHIFIAHDVLCGLNELQQRAGANFTMSSLILCPWLRVRAVLNSVLATSTDGGLRRWAKLADGLLKKLGVYSFSGFSGWNMKVPDGDFSASRVFWNRYLFQGWNSLPTLTIPTSNTSNRIFFKK